MTRLILWFAAILSVHLLAPAALAQGAEQKHIATKLIAEPTRRLPGAPSPSPFR
jgi:hypothetical protein